MMLSKGKKQVYVDYCLHCEYWLLHIHYKAGLQDVTFHDLLPIMDSVCKETCENVQGTVMSQYV